MLWAPTVYYGLRIYIILTLVKFANLVRKTINTGQHREEVSNPSHQERGHLS